VAATVVVSQAISDLSQRIGVSLMMGEDLFFDGFA